MPLNLLRKSVGLSFVFGTIALTWFACNMYRGIGLRFHEGGGHGHRDRDRNRDRVLLGINDSVEGANTPGIAAFTHAIYGLGITWWIVTCVLAYLGPVLMPNNESGCGSKPHQPPEATGTTANSDAHKGSSSVSSSSSSSVSSPHAEDRTRRIVYWCLVVAPSLVVFLYGTGVKLPSAMAMIASGKKASEIEVFEWISIGIVASALPTGTAGMMSMGIYVFGTVARYNPLWSAYVVLPQNGSNTNKNNNNNINNSSGHANLMKDALRLHQWAGYVTLIWFALHTFLYCVMYGFRGLQQGGGGGHDAAAATAEDTTESSSGPSTAVLFFGAMWHAIYPPEECRPILGWNSENPQRRRRRRAARKLYRFPFEERYDEDDDDDDDDKHEFLLPATVGFHSRFLSENKHNENENKVKNKNNQTITQSSSSEIDASDVPTSAPTATELTKSPTNFPTEDSTVLPITTEKPIEASPTEAASTNTTTEEEPEGEEESGGGGGCYDMSIHKCDCESNRCSQELCLADGGIWTEECPEPCEHCGENSKETDPPVEANQFTVDPTGGVGACFDSTTHKCDCEPNRCNEKLCLADGGIWSFECPKFCETCEGNGSGIVMDKDANAGGTIPNKEADVVDDGSNAAGACYDITIHKCDCESNRCNEKLCLADGGIWTEDCSEKCRSCGDDDPSSSLSSSVKSPPTSSPPPKKQQHHASGQCYGYYRNFNGFLAILSLLALVLTSLNFVRRASYRFFYVSHLITATVFLITMILHMKRIIVYLMPSLVLYLATTVPTWIQSLVGAYFDGGVHIEDCTVLEASTTTSQTNTINGQGDGVIELTFLVEPTSGEIREATLENNNTSDSISSNLHRISHRPKSVRICVPSISLLWYPFTVIEPVSAVNDDEANTNLLRYKILLGTVGYFTKTLWMRLYKLQQQQQQQQELLENEAMIDEEHMNDENEIFMDEEEHSVKAFRQKDKTDGKHPRSPLILIDGFYSGTSDWMESAFSHDVVLIATGGTGVTPFLTLLPKLLTNFLHQQEETYQGPDVVSFLWCCRDEALIKHVVTTYLLPLLEMTQQQQEHSGSHESNDTKFRIMIYNTSRDRSDTTPLNISNHQRHPTKKTDALQRGLPMNPSRLQHHPFSSRSQAVARALIFLAISIFSVGIHLWTNNLVLENRMSFMVRLYGLFAIVAWSAIVGLLAEIIFRSWKAYSRRHIRKGYTIADRDCSHKSSSSIPTEESTSASSSSSMESSSLESVDDALQIVPIAPFTRLELASLAPGQIYESGKSSESTIVELSLSYGRPVLDSSGEIDEEKTDNEMGEIILSPSETTVKEVVGADRPGVFYCGPTGLLDTIKANIASGRNERQQITNLAECTFYEESFEM